MINVSLKTTKVSAKTVSVSHFKYCLKENWVKKHLQNFWDKMRQNEYWQKGAFMLLNWQILFCNKSQSIIQPKIGRVLKLLFLYKTIQSIPQLYYFSVYVFKNVIWKYENHVLCL